MTIHAVKVTRWPAADPAGAGWDVFDGPDLRLHIEDGGQVLYQSPNIYEDAVGSQTILFTPQLPVLFPDRPLTFALFDYDDNLSADDYMGGIVGKPYQAGNGFPLSFVLDCQGCKIAVELSVSYLF